MDNFINAEGPFDCKIAFIGEAPGRDEVTQRRPFVGAAGVLFDNRLRTAGIIRKKCLINNVLKIRPQPNGNDVRPYLDLSKKYPIESDIYLEMVELLKEELTKCTANVFVAVGGTALWALCGLKAVSKRRGSILPCSLIPGRKVIPIIHPAAALRQYIFNHYIAFDLIKIKKESEFPEIRRPELGLDINLHPSDSLEYLDFILNKANFSIAFDIEVVNEEVSCISLSRMGFHAISIPFGKEDKVEDEAKIWLSIAKILERPDIKKIGQNLSFDSTFLFRKYGIRVTNIEDTMIAEAIINPDFPKALDFIVSIYTDEPYYKDDLKKYTKMQTDEETFWRYNAKDSAVCMTAMPKMHEDLDTLGNKEVYETQCRLIEPLVYMAERGIRADIDGLKSESIKISSEIETLQEDLNSVIGREININSPKQLKEYFYTEKGITPYKSRTGSNRGAITVDKHALKRLSKRDFKEAKIILRMRALSKIRSTYLEVKVSSDNRIRCSFNPVGGDGRLSSSTNIFGEGTNLQNWPHPMLIFLLADERYIIYNADLQQADSRVVAYISPEARMIEIFENNLDIHSIAASGIFNKEPSDITREPGDCPICEDPILCGHEGERFWGKKAGHGINYGLGFKQFAFLYEISEIDARKILSSYMRMFSGLETYHSWVQEQLRRDRSLRDCWGWNRRFMDRWGPELFKQAYSFIPRSTVSGKINRDGLLHIWDSSSLEKVELLNQVHDSVVFQIPLSAGWKYHVRAIKEIKKNLEKPIRWKGIEFVIPVGVKMGVNLREMTEIKEFTNVEIKETYDKISQ